MKKKRLQFNYRGIGRTILFVTISLCFIEISCNKPIGEDSPPPPAPLKFVLIDKAGKSLVHSLKDTVSLSYVVNGVTQTFRPTVYKIEVSPTDTTLIAQYGGFVLLDLDRYDHSSIAGFSGMGTHTFNLSVNSVSAGTLYIDYLGYTALSSPRPPSSLFTFNNIPIITGSLVGVFSDGTHIGYDTVYPNAASVYVLQLQ